MEDYELLRVEDAARLMQVGRSTVYEWITEGLVPIFRLHGVVRIPRTALLAMIDEQIQASTAMDSDAQSTDHPEKRRDG